MGNAKSVMHEDCEECESSHSIQSQNSFHLGHLPVAWFASNGLTSIPLAIGICGSLRKIWDRTPWLHGVLSQIFRKEPQIPIANGMLVKPLLANQATGRCPK